MSKKKNTSRSFISCVSGIKPRFPAANSSQTFVTPVTRDPLLSPDLQGHLDKHVLTHTETNEMNLLKSTAADK